MAKNYRTDISYVNRYIREVVKTFGTESREYSEIESILYRLPKVMLNISNKGYVNISESNASIYAYDALYKYDVSKLKDFLQLSGTVKARAAIRAKRAIKNRVSLRKLTEIEYELQLAIDTDFYELLDDGTVNEEQATQIKDVFSSMSMLKGDAKDQKYQEALNLFIKYYLEGEEYEEDYGTGTPIPDVGY